MPTACCTPLRYSSGFVKIEPRVLTKGSRTRLRQQEQPQSYISNPSLPQSCGDRRPRSRQQHPDRAPPLIDRAQLRFIRKDTNRSKVPQKKTADASHTQHSFKGGGTTDCYQARPPQLALEGVEEHEVFVQPQEGRVQPVKRPANLVQPLLLGVVGQTGSGIVNEELLWTTPHRQGGFERGSTRLRTTTNLTRRGAPNQVRVAEHGGSCRLSSALQVHEMGHVSY